MTRYTAVVETGWRIGIERWEERRSCGHRHHTYDAAMNCGNKLYNAHYVNGSWCANADWHNFKIHDQDQKRVEGTRS